MWCDHAKLLHLDEVDQLRCLRLCFEGVSGLKMMVN